MEEQAARGLIAAVRRREVSTVVVTKLRRAIQSVYGWCRRPRHLPVAVQHKALTRRIQGHFTPASVIALMRATPNGEWAQFKRMLSRVYPNCNEQIELALEQ